MLPRAILTIVVLLLPALNRVIAQTVEPKTTAASIGVTLQLRNDVQLQSFVVRVGDVVRPVGSHPTGWDELSEKALGLIPPGGQLRMERQRINECLERSKMLHEPVRWSGPETVAISYTMPDEVSIQNPIQNHGPSIRQVTYDRAKDTNYPIALRNVPESNYKSLLPAERNRVERMIMAALGATYPEILETYEAVIPTDDPGIHRFNDLRAVRALRFLDPPAAGLVTIEILGEAELSELSGTVKLELVKLPIIAFTSTALNRGDILSPRDVIMQPIARARYDQRQVQDLELILNKELTRSISSKQPILIGDLSEPVVINRGDRVELRVVGAGVTVVTGALALAPAAAGESVMVETEQPKQKIAARAVRSGLVEIVTRPPQIR